MNRNDFVKLIGADQDEAEYLPVACLLRDGYACAGYYNRATNEGLQDTCVLLNTRIVGFREGQNAVKRPAIATFGDFMEEIVNQYASARDGEARLDPAVYGRSVPLMAIPLDQMVIVYPVAHIGLLMKRIEAEAPRGDAVPTFLDFDNKSVVLKLLRTKIW